MAEMSRQALQSVIVASVKEIDDVPLATSFAQVLDSCRALGARMLGSVCGYMP